MGLLEDIIKGATQGGGLGDILNQGNQQQQQQYPQQGNNSGQPTGDISIKDLEREMGIGTQTSSGTTPQQQYPQQQYPQQQYPQQQYPQQQYPQQQYPQQQYPQQQYPQQQYPQQTGGSVIPGVDDYLPTGQNQTLPTGQQQQQLPGCSMPGCSGNLWKMLGLGALIAFLFRKKS